MKSKVNVEHLHHFQCGGCEKWWSIGDAPSRSRWFCPWCGVPQSADMPGDSEVDPSECETEFYRSRDGFFSHTVSGRKFYPLDCRTEDIHIGDIAHALSNICRYGGHTRWHYSVAQHSVYVSHMCRPENALWGLLHDAAEAYVGDIIRPLKHNIPRFEGFERYVFSFVQDKFGIPGEMPPDVVEADSQILYPEAEALLGLDPDEEGWFIPVSRPDAWVEIERMTPEQARKAFLDRFYDLTSDG